MHTASISSDSEVCD